MGRMSAGFLIFRTFLDSDAIERNDDDVDKGDSIWKKFLGFGYIGP